MQRLKKYEDPSALYMVSSFLTGFFIAGVYNTIITLITVELSKEGGKRVTATVSSLIAGYSSVLSSLNQILVPVIEEYLFVYCSALVLCASILLIPMVR